jgi:CheY-like chemotaxis protein
MTTILIIDDETVVLRIVGQMLELEGYAVHVAQGGAEGLRVAAENAPDLIICDVSMPEVDGFAVLAGLRQRVATENVPVIMITGMHDKAILQRILADGARAYLTKPFTRDALMGAVDKIFAGN